ncbi:MAG: hypothetical protein ACO3QC_03920, partial [Phycisphaerales bacterium]
VRAYAPRGVSRLTAEQVALAKDCVIDAIVLDPTLAFDPRIKGRLFDFDRLGDDTKPTSALQPGLALAVDPMKPCGVQMASERASEVATMDFSQVSCTLVRGSREPRPLALVANGTRAEFTLGGAVDLLSLEVEIRGSLGLVFASRRLKDASGAPRSTVVLQPASVVVDRVALETPLG